MESLSHVSLAFNSKSDVLFVTPLHQGHLSQVVTKISLQNSHLIFPAELYRKTVGLLNASSSNRLAYAEMYGGRLRLLSAIFQSRAGMRVLGLLYSVAFLYILRQSHGWDSSDVSNRLGVRNKDFATDSDTLFGPPQLPSL